MSKLKAPILVLALVAMVAFCSLLASHSGNQKLLVPLQANSRILPVDTAVGSNGAIEDKLRSIEDKLKSTEDKLKSTEDKLKSIEDKLISERGSPPLDMGLTTSNVMIEDKLATATAATTATTPKWVVFLRIQKTASTFVAKSVKFASQEFGTCDCSWNDCRCQTHSAGGPHGMSCSQMTCIETCEEKGCRHMWANPPHADWADLEAAFSRANNSAESVAFMTVLRKPVDRVLSEYRYLDVLGGRHCGKETVAWDYRVQCQASLEEFLNSTQAAHRFNNRQTHMIAGLGDETVQNKYGTPHAMLEQAKQHLQQMPWFGITERIDDSLWLLQHASQELGFKLAIHPLKDANVSKKRPQAEDEKWKSRIEKENQLDMQLYDFAEELFEKRLQEARTHKSQV